MTSNNTNEYTSEQVNVQVSTPSVSSSQPIEGNNYEEVSPDVNEPIKDEPIITKKRRKTSAVWNNFEEIELENGTKKAMCLYCKEKLSTGGRGASTSHLKRHSEICLSRKLHLSRENKQTTIQFRQPTESGDARLKSFHEVVELKGLKERKLILDCPTRWNSTFLMLRTAMKFKHAFSDYNEKEPHYKYAPSFEEWDKIEKVCPVLEVFNDATHVISGTYYPTSNLYLAEILRVKKIIDETVESFDIFMSEMAKPMKAKFDKYWGECNLLMAIACVLDPRMKLNGIKISFLRLYKTQSDVEKNVEKVKRALEELYIDYVNLYSRDASSTCGHSDLNVEQYTMVDVVQQMDKGMQELLTMVYQSQSIPPTKSELETYLEENIFIPTPSSSFCALEWWKDKSSKFKVLSKMAVDILAVPISSVASESTFSAGGRVIDEYRSNLNEQSIEALICGGDWLRNKYGLKKTRKLEMVEFGQEEIILKN